VERHLDEHAISVRPGTMVMRGEISKGYMISRRGWIAGTKGVGGRAAESVDRAAVGDFSSRANRVESDRRGQALVEMTVGPCGFIFGIQ
jgi:hypothetical protein